MKKIFKFSHEKKNPQRLVEACKHEIKKYMKRERSKKLPEGATFWDFTFKFGATADEAKPMTHLELNQALEDVLQANLTEAYVEVLAKAVTKAKSE